MPRPHPPRMRCFNFTLAAAQLQRWLLPRCRRTPLCSVQRHLCTKQQNTSFLPYVKPAHLADRARISRRSHWLLSRNKEHEIALGGGGGSRGGWSDGGVLRAAARAAAACAAAVGDCVGWTGGGPCAGGGLVTFGGGSCKSGGCPDGGGSAAGGSCDAAGGVSAAAAAAAAAACRLGGGVGACSRNKRLQMRQKQDFSRWTGGLTKQFV